MPADDARQRVSYSVFDVAPAVTTAPFEFALMSIKMFTRARDRYAVTPDDMFQTAMSRYVEARRDDYTRCRGADETDIRLILRRHTRVQESYTSIRSFTIRHAEMRRVCQCRRCSGGIR